MLQGSQSSFVVRGAKGIQYLFVPSIHTCSYEESLHRLSGTVSGFGEEISTLWQGSTLSQNCIHQVTKGEVRASGQVSRVLDNNTRARQEEALVSVLFNLFLMWLLP